MKRLLVTTVGLAALSVFAFGDIKWEHDLEKAKKTAKSTKQLIFIDFYADW